MGRVRVGATCLLRLGGWAVGCSASAATEAADPEQVDLLVRNGVIYDGRGGVPYKGDIAVADGRVVATGNLASQVAQQTVDAHGLAVAPGFINMLSWAGDSLIYDGRGLSDLKQGVTLEVFGEGDSFGPLAPTIRAEMLKTQTDSHYELTWATTGECRDTYVA